MTRKRRLILTLMIAGMAAILWIFLATQEREPVWQGRKLSYWLAVYERDPSSVDASTAVHNIGSNALPLLVKWISYKPPMWKARVFTIALRIGGDRLFRIMARSEARSDRALVGFKILGPEAAPAVPALTNLLAGLDWKSRGTFEQVVLALNHIGNDGLASLVSVVTNKSAPGDFRWTAAARIRDPVMKLDTNANWVVPVLVVYLDDNQVAIQIAIILGDLRLEPAVAVPALTHCLQDTNNDYPALQIEAAKSLGRFGKDAASAVPELVNALSSNDWNLWDAARNALQSIAPEVLKKREH